jgi:hypothetical protein
MWPDLNLLHSLPAAVATAGTTEEFPVNETITAGACANSDIIVGEAVFSFTSNGNAKRFRVYIGTTAIFDLSVTNETRTSFSVAWKLYGLPASTSKIAHVWYERPSDGVIVSVAEVAVTQDFAAAWDAKVSLLSGTTAGHATVKRSYWARAEGRA